VVNRRRTIVAVLAGGSGERIGGAKATVQLAGQPLISYPLAAARSAGLRALVVAKPRTPLPRLAEPVIREPERPVHPLCGVLAALDHVARSDPAAAVLLVGCDMPFLTAELLAWIAGLEGAAVPEAAGRMHPLLSRCPLDRSDRVESALARGSSLTAALVGPDTRVIAESELRRFGDPRRLLFNVNERDDLAVAERMLAAA
jgi:molybdopterin-guanine dinucleotide biosynthesis protein A